MFSVSSSSSESVLSMQMDAAWQACRVKFLITLDLKVGKSSKKKVPLNYIPQIKDMSLMKQ